MKEKLIDFDTAKLTKDKGLCKYFEHGMNYVTAFNMKKWLLGREWLWRLVMEKEERDELDGWFPESKVYKHLIYKATIHYQKGISTISKKEQIIKYINWYEKRKYNNTLG